MSDSGQVGVPGGAALSHDEAAAQFALWAILKSLLVVSADLRFVSCKLLASLHA